MRSVIHELRVLQGIVGEALDELEELYTNPPQDDARAKAMDFPSLNKMYDPNTAEEAMTATPEVARAISLIVAAASQLSASVQHPFLTICDAATAYHLPACLRVFEACGAVELMKEAGEKGVSIETIAENCPGGKVDSRRLAHIFRLLATHHIIIEVSPGDVFALNRISGCLVTHPEPSPASAVPTTDPKLHTSDQLPNTERLEGVRKNLSTALQTPSSTETSPALRVAEGGAALESAITLAICGDVHDVATPPAPDHITSTSTTDALRPRYLDISFSDPLDFDSLLSEGLPISSDYTYDPTSTAHSPRTMRLRGHSKADSWEVRSRPTSPKAVVSPKVAISPKAAKSTKSTIVPKAAPPSPSAFKGLAKGKSAMESMGKTLAGVASALTSRRSVEQISPSLDRSASLDKSAHVPKDTAEGSTVPVAATTSNSTSVPDNPTSTPGNSTFAQSNSTSTKSNSAFTPDNSASTTGISTSIPSTSTNTALGPTTAPPQTPAPTRTRPRGSSLSLSPLMQPFPCTPGFSPTPGFAATPGISSVSFTGGGHLSTGTPVFSSGTHGLHNTPSHGVPNTPSGGVPHTPSGGLPHTPRGELAGTLSGGLPHTPSAESALPNTPHEEGPGYGGNSVTSSPSQMRYPMSVLPSSPKTTMLSAFGHGGAFGLGNAGVPFTVRGGELRVGGDPDVDVPGKVRGEEQEGAQVDLAETLGSLLLQSEAADEDASLSSSVGKATTTPISTASQTSPPTVSPSVVRTPGVPQTPASRPLPRLNTQSHPVQSELAVPSKPLPDLPQALRKPEDKYVDTNGIAAYIGLCTDELFKASAYLLESLLVRPQYEMDEECSPAHKIEAEETESEEFGSDLSSASSGSYLSFRRSAVSSTHTHRSPVSPTTTLGGLTPISPTLSKQQKAATRPVLRKSKEGQDQKRGATLQAIKRAKTLEDTGHDIKKAANASPPSIPPFNYAFRTDKPYFAWLEGGDDDADGERPYLSLKREMTLSVNRREQEFRLARFGRAMTGTTSIEGYGGIWNALDWLALPKGSLVVDVGGGIGSTSVMLARGGMKDMGARFIVQDRGAVCKLGEEMMTNQCKDLLDAGVVTFQEHDFFTPQPEHLKGPAVYLLRVVLHDWADPLCRKILLRLRQAVIPGKEDETKLVIAEFVLPLACVDESLVSSGTQDSPEGSKRRDTRLPEDAIKEEVENTDDGVVDGAVKSLAPPPLLANLGKANASAYWMDLTMQCVFNSQERTLRELVDLALSAGWKVKTVRRGAGSLFSYVVAEPTDVPEDAEEDDHASHEAALGPTQQTITADAEDVESVSSSGEDAQKRKKVISKETAKERERLRLMEQGGSRCSTPTFGSVGHLPLTAARPPFRTGGGRWQASSIPVQAPATKLKRRPTPLVGLSSGKKQPESRKRVFSAQDSPVSSRPGSAMLLGSPQTIRSPAKSMFATGSSSGPKSVLKKRSSYLPLSPTKASPSLPSLSPGGDIKVDPSASSHTTPPTARNGLLSPPPSGEQPSAVFSNELVTMVVNTPARPSYLYTSAAPPSTPLTSMRGPRRVSAQSTVSSISAVSIASTASAMPSSSSALSTPRRLTRSLSRVLTPGGLASPPPVPPPQIPLPTVPGTPTGPMTSQKKPMRERRSTMSYGNLKGAAAPAFPSIENSMAAAGSSRNVHGKKLDAVPAPNVPRAHIRERRATISSSKIPVLNASQMVAPPPLPPAFPRGASPHVLTATVPVPVTPSTPGRLKKVASRRWLPGLTSPRANGGGQGEDSNSGTHDISAAGGSEAPTISATREEVLVQTNGPEHMQLGETRVVQNSQVFPTTPPHL